jgi:hypothetical protein
MGNQYYGTVSLVYWVSEDHMSAEIHVILQFAERPEKKLKTLK